MPQQQQQQSTRTWGPSLWRAIHFVALGFPAGRATDMQKEAYRLFYRGLDNVLPCPTCAESYRRHLERDVRPVEEAIAATTAERPDALFEWTVDLHNVVNRELGKVGGEFWTPARAKAALLSLETASAAAAARRPPAMLAFLAVLTLALLCALVAALLLMRHRHKRASY